jgi:hypothetical protein
MSEFDQAVQHERMRMMGLIAEAKERITELQGQVAADEMRIEALDAYDRVKAGRVAGPKSTKKGLRRPKAAGPEATSTEPADN